MGGPEATAPGNYADFMNLLKKSAPHREVDEDDGAIGSAGSNEGKNKKKHLSLFHKRNSTKD